MESDRYPDCVRELYRSEIFGERITLILLERARNPVERYKLATILQLETETKARLRPFLMRLGLSLIEDDVSAEVAQVADAIPPGSWRDMMAGMREDVAGYVRRFEEIERLGPEEDREILHSMVAHERSILTFAERELAGVPNSLDDIIAQLHHPLPPPEGGY